MRLLLLALLIPAFAFAQDDPVADIKEFQKTINKEFKGPDTSPLEPKERKRFRSLPFYDIDLQYRVVATLRRTEGSDFKPAKTTTSRISMDRVYGMLEFTLGGREFSIPVYQTKDLMTRPGFEDYLFFPFTDLTNDAGTYPGGRYIDLRIPEGDEIVLDFNKAYNPSCAYNSKYSCPIVPSENNVDLEIKAGVKYQGKGH